MLLPEHFSLTYSGFEPSDDVKRWIDAILVDTQFKSPTHSFLKATFKCTGNIFVGVIDITSAAGHFVIKATASDVRELGIRLKSGAKVELDKWRLQRAI